MTDATRLPLARSREELRAARALLEAGFPSQAVARAYMAGYQAATAALLAVGELPATPTGVVSAFGRRVVADGGLDRDAARGLRRLFEDRNDVDYALAEASGADARRSIDDAEQLIYAAERWLAARSATPAPSG
jgi:uncharacterized protein (UPF0332 family)